MKARQSGMPEEGMWAGFFEPDAVLRTLGLQTSCGDVVDFGCGYGTFTVAAARIVSGTVYALDIEPEMVRLTEAKAREAGLRNIRVSVRDFIAEGSGLSPRRADFAMLFNILHAEHPETLLGEAYRVLAPGGRLAIIHWNCDPTTPRGPSMEIRPRAEQCRDWAIREGFCLLEPGIVDLPPYHYGLVLRRPP